MLVENCQRSDLTPLEEADGYQGLLDLGVGVGELAAKTGRSESFVRGRLRIARIPADVRSGSEAFAQLSLSQLDDLAEFEAYPDMMAELASMAGTKNWDWKRGQLRSRVRVEAWQQSMRTVLEALGLTVDVSASAWTTPEATGSTTCGAASPTSSKNGGRNGMSQPVRTADNPVQRLHRIVLPAIVA